MILQFETTRSGVIKLIRTVRCPQTGWLCRRGTRVRCRCRRAARSKGTTAWKLPTTISAARTAPSSPDRPPESEVSLTLLSASSVHQAASHESPKPRCYIIFMLHMAPQWSHQVISGPKQMGLKQTRCYTLLFHVKVIVRIWNRSLILLSLFLISLLALKQIQSFLFSLP